MKRVSQKMRTIVIDVLPQQTFLRADPLLDPLRPLVRDKRLVLLAIITPAQRKYPLLGRPRHDCVELGLLSHDRLEFDLDLLEAGDVLELVAPGAVPSDHLVPVPRDLHPPPHLPRVDPAVLERIDPEIVVVLPQPPVRVPQCDGDLSGPDPDPAQGAADLAPQPLEAVLLHEEVQVLHGGALVGRHPPKVLLGRGGVLDVRRGPVEPEGVLVRGDGHEVGLEVDAAAGLEQRRVDAPGALEARAVVQGALPVGGPRAGVGVAVLEGELVDPVADLWGDDGEEGAVRLIVHVVWSDAMTGTASESHFAGRRWISIEDWAGKRRV